MIFNLCLIVFLIFNFLILFAGLGAIMQKIELISESLKQIADLLNKQFQMDTFIKSGLEDILNNTVCIYQRLEEIDPDLSNSEAVMRVKNQKTYN